ncbi:MAG: mannose-6-phosphate isomerase [Chloroflexi bacterium CFX4]|nr:mannose-6-phosphate isomerase [Chloroflexi bacterium CFX4]MDL1923375.1 mannose-6-phosphate isomerase [Chloroflexi bacterium CFX3]
MFGQPSKWFYPLLFEPSLHVKVWGGRQLATRLGKRLPTDEPYGESWEIFWRNHIANGEDSGKALGQLIREFPEAMTGNPNAESEFPLLIKFLDAQDWLSVQVHPDDALARQLEGEPRGKTECWYIVDAAPNAQLIYGFSQPTNAQEFSRAIAEGRARDYLQFVPVQAGDFIHVPAGMMHAIGPGILLYELQQTSDTTYRVYDWDRMGLDGKPRPLHLEKALQCTRFEVNPPAKVPYTVHEVEGGITYARLIEGQYFSLRRFSLPPQTRLKITYDGKAHLLTVINGTLDVSAAMGKDASRTVVATAGTSVFVPARADFFMTALGSQPAEVLIASEGALGRAVVL